MDQQARPLKLMSTLAVAVAFRKSVLPAFEATSGVAPEVDWGPTTVLERRIAEGARADAIVLIDGAMEKLVAAGLIGGASVRKVARSLVGLAVAPGAPRPDISSVEALRETLLSGRVAYSRGGASGIFFARLLADLGIADAVNARAAIIPEGFTAEKILLGEADLAIQQVSELKSVEGVDVVGPLPDGAQEGIDLSAGIFAGADRAAAEGFIAAATSAEAARAYCESGLVPRF